MKVDETAIPSLDSVTQPTPIVRDVGGVFRVGSTRVRLESVIGQYEAGASPEEIVMAFSTLDLPTVYAAIAIYLHNRPEFERYLATRRAEAEELERRSNTPQVQALRARLLRLRQSS